MLRGEEEPQGSLMPEKLTGWLASPRGAQLLPACPSKAPFEPPVPNRFLIGKGVARSKGELGRTEVSGRKDDAELALGRVLLMLASCGGSLQVVGATWEHWQGRSPEQAREPQGTV